MHEKYFPQALNVLEELAPKKINLYEYSEFHIVITGKNYNYPIHVDTHNKLLSGVIYLKPEKNSGTKLYEENKKDSIDFDSRNSLNLSIANPFAIPDISK